MVVVGEFTLVVVVNGVNVVVCLDVVMLVVFGAATNTSGTSGSMTAERRMNNKTTLNDLLIYRPLINTYLMINKRFMIIPLQDYTK